MSLQERVNRLQPHGAAPVRYGELSLSEAGTPAMEHVDTASRGHHRELRRRAQQAVREELGPRLASMNDTPESLEALVSDRADRLLGEQAAREQVLLTAEVHDALRTRIVDEVVGAGPLQVLLRDDEVDEIMVNGPDQVFCERRGLITPTGIAFDDEEHLRHVIGRIVSRVGRRVDEASPMVDARLPDGSRVNVVLPPIALDGPVLTIRKFPAARIGMEDLISWGSLTTAAAEFLRACVITRRNIVISGGTGSGKTTTLGVLADYIDAGERVVTVEDAAELRLPGDHVIRLEARPPGPGGAGAIGIRDLVRNALRMRPDRIIVGEVRDEAALDMLQAMNTGHEGSIGTVHANSPRDAVSRIETMVLMAGLDLPVRVVREQIAASLDIIVQQSREPSGSRHVTRITEVVGLEGDVVVLEDIFAAGQSSLVLEPTGLRPRFFADLAAVGGALPHLLSAPFATQTTWAVSSPDPGAESESGTNSAASTRPGVHSSLAPTLRHRR